MLSTNALDLQYLKCPSVWYFFPSFEQTLRLGLFGKNPFLNYSFCSNQYLPLACDGGLKIHRVIQLNKISA